MFKPNEIEAMPVVLEGYFKDLENRIMEDIVRRIRINSEITSTADLQMQRLSEMGASKKAIKDYIQQALQLSEQGIDDLYNGAIQKGYNSDRDLYTATGRDFIPYSENQQLQQLVEAVKKQTNSDIKNITQSMGFAVRQPDGKLTFQPIADYYQKTLDKAVLDITSGSFDYNTVLKRTVQEMTDSGLRWIDYASGHHNRVPVAVRRAVMTGVNQVTAKIAEQNMELLQTEYVEVSWHRGARPSHQVWQGKIYHWKEKAISRQTKTTPPTSPKNPPVNQKNNLTFAENYGNIKLTSTMSAPSDSIENPKSPVKVITQTQLDEFKENLKEINFFTVQVGGVDQFSTYGGDFDVLKKIAEHLKKLVARFPLLYREDGLLLGYEDFGNSNDFALTRKNTIVLNKKIFDDTEYLKKSYDELEKQNFFTKGTDYTSVIDHECGHMLMNRQKAKKNATIKKITQIVNDKAKQENLSLDEYIKAYISEYATFQDLKGVFIEIPSELVAMLNGNNKELAEDILKEVGLL